MNNTGDSDVDKKEISLLFNIRKKAHIINSILYEVRKNQYPNRYIEQVDVSNHPLMIMRFGNGEPFSTYLILQEDLTNELEDIKWEFVEINSIPDSLQYRIIIRIYGSEDDLILFRLKSDLPVWDEK